MLEPEVRQAARRRRRRAMGARELVDERSEALHGAHVAAARSTELAVKPRAR
jgi:hypothetical protein